MSRNRTIFQNIAILTIQHVVVNLVSVLAVGYVARRLGNEDYGVFALAFSLVAIFMAFSSFGLRQLAIREMSRERENPEEVLGRIIPARILFMLLTLLAMAMAVPLLGYKGNVVIALCWAALNGVFDQGSRIILDVFQSVERIGRIIFRDIFIKIFVAGGSILVLMAGRGLNAVFAVYVAGSLVGFLINLALYRREFKWPRLRVDRHYLVWAMREGVGYVMVSVASMIYTRIDIVMLSKMGDAVSVGIYAAAVNLYYRLNVFSDAIATAFFPAFSQMYWQDRQKTKEIYSNIIYLTAWASLPLAVGGYFVGTDLVLLIFGEDYIQAGRIFALLCLSLPLMFLNTVFNYCLGAMGKQYLVGNIVMLLCGVNFVLNLVLIRSLGMSGAAIATVATQVCGFVVFFVLTGKHIRPEFRPGDFSIIVFSNALLFSYLYWLRQGNVLVDIAVCIGCYGIISIITLAQRAKGLYVEKFV